jgi:hypothetical protein
MFEVAVRETEELSVYVADAWFPMEVPAAVCAVPGVETSSVPNASITTTRKGRFVQHADLFPSMFVYSICFSSIEKTRAYLEAQTIWWFRLGGETWGKDLGRKLLSSAL